MANKEMTAEQTTAEVKRDTTDAPALERHSFTASILIIDSDRAVETQGNVEDTIWHDLQNTHRTRKILIEQPDGIEHMEGDGTITIIYYGKFCVTVPLIEMIIHLSGDESHNYDELSQRQNKIFGNMFGCKIDFIIKGLDNSSRSLVASHKDAMLKKWQIFYLPDANGNPRVCVGRVVQACMVAVAKEVIRIEIFGVETSILAHDLSWDWLGDASEMFRVGDQILVRVLDITTDDLEHTSIRADVKSANGNTSKADPSKCKTQDKYAGTITDIHRGAVFVHLFVGVNVIAHSRYDSQTPDKEDEVSSVVARIDESRNVAVGLISRIVRQNI